MEPIEAAGGVLWREGRTTPEVALVHRPKYGDWSLPKGKLDRGEHPLLAALREVREETCFTARPGRPLGQSLYEKEGRGKRVRWWSLEALRGRFVPGAEVDDLRWESPERALDVVSAARDRPPLEAFLAAPVRTTALLVVRHASAGDRASWRGEDRRRPLDHEGQRQAQALAQVLAAYGPRLLVSADVTRCEQTLQPLAEATGLPVARTPLLSEHGFGDDPEGALGALRQLASAGRAAVVCTQRGPLPELVQQLYRELSGTTLALDLPRKGATVVLHLADGQVVAAEVLPAP